MSRKVETLARAEDLDQLSQEDLVYLAQRDRLPSAARKQLEIDEDARDAVAKLLRGEPAKLADLPHTGDVNTLGKTQEDIDMETEQAEKQREADGRRREGIAEKAEAGELEVDWSEQNKDTLIEELERRGLSVEGKKADMVARLDEDDAKRR